MRSKLYVILAVLLVLALPTAPAFTLVYRVTMAADIGFGKEIIVNAPDECTWRAPRYTWLSATTYKLNDYFVECYDPAQLCRSPAVTGQTTGGAMMVDAHCNTGFAVCRTPAAGGSCADADTTVYAAPPLRFECETEIVFRTTDVGEWTSTCTLPAT